MAKKPRTIVAFISLLYFAGCVHSETSQHTSVATLNERCAAGVRGSCVEAAQAYLRGDGTGRDVPRAVSLLKSVCDEGDLGSCAQLGWVYLANRALYASSLAVDPFKRACEGGVARACYGLGSLYTRGEAVKKDESQAARLFEKSCLADAHYGCVELGWMAREGHGIPLDLAQSRTLFEIACSAKVGDGCSALGVLYTSGDAVQPDPQHAVVLFEQGCQLGSQTGCFNLAMTLLTTAPHKNPARARELLEKGCNANYGLACFQLATMSKSPQLLDRACDLGVGRACYEAAEQEPATNEGRQWASDKYKKSCNTKYQPGCVSYGTILMNAGQRAQAVSLVQSACASGESFGCYLLGNWYAGGLASKPNNALAAMYYRKACDGNAVPNACAKLKIVEKKLEAGGHGR